MWSANSGSDACRNGARKNRFRENKSDAAKNPGLRGGQNQSANGMMAFCLLIRGWAAEYFCPHGRKNLWPWPPKMQKPTVMAGFRSLSSWIVTASGEAVNCIRNSPSGALPIPHCKEGHLRRLKMMSHHATTFPRSPASDQDQANCNGKGLIPPVFPIVLGSWLRLKKLRPDCANVLKPLGLFSRDAMQLRATRQYMAL